MSGQSSIQWTEATWNPVVGCTRVSSGCDHCYAFQLHDRRHIAWKRGRWPSAPAQYHQPFSRVQLLEDRLEDPKRWRKPRRVFVNSMSDLFHPDVSGEFINQVWMTMFNTKRHTYQILTKRPERLLEWTQRKARATCWPIEDIWPSWIWLGVSVENQQAADERIPLLLQTPATVRFLSCEPLIDAVDLAPWLTLGWICELCHRRVHSGCLPDDWDLVFQSAICPDCLTRADTEGIELAGARGGMYATTPDPRPFTPGLDWVIIGGESGKHARVMNPRWALSLIEQCRESGVAVFCKQMGTVWATANKASDSHGGNPLEWPQEFRVREYPLSVVGAH